MKKQIDRQRNKEIDREMEGQIEKWGIDREMEGQIEKQIDRLIKRDSFHKRKKENNIDRDKKKQIVRKKKQILFHFNKNMLRKKEYARKNTYSKFESFM